MPIRPSTHTEYALDEARPYGTLLVLPCSALTRRSRPHPEKVRSLGLLGRSECALLSLADAAFLSPAYL